MLQKCATFAALSGKRFVVEVLRGVRIERQVELILPAELKSCFGQGIVSDLRAGMAFRQVCGVGGNFVGDDAGLHVFSIGQTQGVLSG